MFLNFLSKTYSNSKIVDCQTKFVREFVHEGILKIIFVKSEDNLADGSTKNISNEAYWKHTKAYMSELKELDEDLDADWIREGVKNVFQTLINIF